MRLILEEGRHVRSRKQRQRRFVLLPETEKIDAFLIREEVFGADQNDRGRVSLHDRHAKPMRRQPFDRHFFDPHKGS